MANLISFETGSEYPLVLTPTGLHIPLATLHELSDTVDQNSFDYINEVALNCNMVRHPSQTIDEKTTEDYIQAFMDGGIVAVGVAKINLKNEYNFDENGLSTVEQFLYQTPRALNLDVATKEDLTQAREECITGITKRYGFAASRIIGALRQNYGQEEGRHFTDISTTRTIAALGFAVIAPQLDDATLQYRHFLGELQRLTEN